MGVLSRSHGLLLQLHFTSMLLTQVLTSSMLSTMRIGTWSIDVESTAYCKRKIYSEAARIQMQFWNLHNIGKLCLWSMRCCEGTQDCGSVFITTGGRRRFLR